MQGFNMGRYVPPDQEGTTTGNALHRKHPLGARASKPGALVVRFEMPFAVWCAHCPRPTLIGQGVRFNAEKRRVGSYHSTPVWSFRMRHVECGGAIEIRTDPKNTAYVVVEGGSKRDTGDEDDNNNSNNNSSSSGGRAAAREGDQVIITDQEREALRKNAFASLERTIDDREQLIQATHRIHGLEAASARHWDDPYAQNQRLRRAFRAGRRDRERDAEAAEDLRERMGGFGGELAAESEEDARRAALVDFGGLGDGDGDEAAAGGRALRKPLFGVTESVDSKTNTAASPSKKLKSEKVRANRKSNLVSQVLDNTRASSDPFLTETSRANNSNGESRAPSARLPGLKRKRDAGQDGPGGALRVSKEGPEKRETVGLVSQKLVQYDSD